MNEKHYKKELSRFVNHELANDERQTVAEHLMRCADCRAEHDEIKLGAALASAIKPSDAPENLWQRIENSLDKKREKVSFFPNFAFFSLRGLAAGLLVMFALTAVYFVFLRSGSPEIVKNEPSVQSPNIEMPPAVSATNEAAPNQTADRTAQTDPTNQTAPDASAKVPNQTSIADSNIKSPPKTAPVPPRENLTARTNPASWDVETLSGMPRIGNSFESEKLTVGEFLETDATSRARVQVADIGNVEIAPNSRVRLVGTKSTEHRLALEKGLLKAQIFAPPRLFIVDTPSAVAVDLGCEYTLEVDAGGNSRLHVTSGFVALENGKFAAIVPAGAIALTRKGKGVGTPFAEDSSAALQTALYKFDFENGGNPALETIFKEAKLPDSLTLWHLLSRVETADRGKVFDALAGQVKPPAGVKREGILRLDKKMLDAWWAEIENVWFE